MKGWSDTIKLAHAKLWDDTPKLEGWSASESPQSVSLGYAGYTAAHFKSYRDEPVAFEVTGAKRETPVKCFKGIQGCSSKKVTQPTAQLKCFYTNVCSVGSKEESQATVLLGSYDLAAITEIW